jgi:hypothetical protein
MADKFIIEITGALPEEEKYAILADAQAQAKLLAGELNLKHKLECTIAVRAVRHKVIAAKPNGATVAVETVRVSSSEAGHG